MPILWGLSRELLQPRVSHAGLSQVSQAQRSSLQKHTLQLSAYLTLHVFDYHLIISLMRTLLYFKCLLHISTVMWCKGGDEETDWVRLSLLTK